MESYREELSFLTPRSLKIITRSQKLHAHKKKAPDGGLGGIIPPKKALSKNIIPPKKISFN